MNLVEETIERGGDLVVSLSGGKDSTATYLHLLESGTLDRVVAKGGLVRRVFADTGWELPATYDYLTDLEARFGPIDRVATWVPGPNEEPPAGFHTLAPIWVTPRGGVDGLMHADRYAFARIIEARLGHYSPLVRLMMEWRKVPTGVRRWCTDDTKKRPIVAYLKQCSDPLNAIGVRAEESPKRALQPAIEWSDDYDAVVWRPIHSWLKADVINIHARHGLAPNPLYLQGDGAGRVGCGPCVYSGDDDLRWLAAHHPGRISILRDIEQILADMNDDRLAKVCWFHVSKNGKAHPIDVDYAVKLASDDLNGDAPLLFAATRSPGCEDWGLCSR